MRSLFQDLRFALRRMHKRSWWSAVIVVTIGLSIGAGVALFSLTKTALIDSWPFEGHDRIMTFRADFPQRGRKGGVWSVPEVVDLSSQTQIFDHVVAGVSRNVNLTGGDAPERVRGVATTAEWFPVLGVQPLLGRTFRPDETGPGASHVVLLDEDLWARRFARDPGIVGRQLDIEGTSYTVIGVMPRRFVLWGADLWFPLDVDFTAGDRRNRFLTFQARLRRGVTPGQASAALDGLARRLEREHGSEVPEYAGWHIEITSLMDRVLRDVRPALWLLLGAVLLVFVLACTNVSNLLLAEVSTREREIAVRSTLGAGRKRLVRQLLTESFVLALLSGALGLLLAYWGVRLLQGLIPPDYLPGKTEVQVDRWAVLVALGVSCVATLLFGLLPALQTVRASRPESLKPRGGGAGSGLRGRRLRDALVVVEVALALVVLVSAGVLIRSFVRITEVNPGFEPRGLVTLHLDLSRDRYPEEHQVGAFFAELLQRIRGLPGVVDAGASTSLPLTSTPSVPVTLEGRSSTDLGGIPDAEARVVAPDYFETMRIPLLGGRLLRASDVEDSERVVVVNRTLARRFWGGSSAIGERLKMGGPDSPNPWMTVVGVVGDVRGDSLDQPPRQAFYIPHGQRARNRNLAIVVRTAGPPQDSVETVRRQVRELDPEQPVYQAQTMEEVVFQSLGAKPLAVVVLSFFALLGLIIGAVGVYGVMAHSVRQRTQEIGIRMALGARRQQVLASVVGHGLRLALIGAGGGLLAAFASSRLLRSLIYGVSARDVVTFLTVPAVLTAVALAASYLPARRASRVDPVVVLKDE